MKTGNGHLHRTLPAIMACGIIGMLMLALPGRAEVIDYIYQSGPNVMSSYSGTLDITDLTPDGSGGAGSYVQAVGAVQIFAGSTFDVYEGISGPGSWGTGGYVAASSSTGDDFGLAGGANELATPESYTSGSALSGTAVFDSQTLATLGLTTGNYTYTWGTGPDADSVVVEIGTAPPAGSAVPEPTSASLMLLGGVALAYPVFLRRRAVTV